jgi:hypothetical protein
MSKSNNNGSSGLSLPVLVFLLFLGLKLAEVGVVATWSWWWVTSPLWIPVAFVIGTGVLAIIIIIIALIFGMSLTDIREKATKYNLKKSSKIKIK